jgi:hypothetical protein
MPSIELDLLLHDKRHLTCSLSHFVDRANGFSVF